MFTDASPFTRTRAYGRQKAVDAAYLAQQLSVFVPSALAQRALRGVSGMTGPKPTTEQLTKLHGRLRALLQRDLANVHEGLYPESLLFQFPISEYLKRVPELMRDLPNVYARRRGGDYRDLPDIKSEYPPYFRRTFHWQTDGYLSRRSARLYDIGVEFLFGGTADVMRRQVIPPITRFLNERAAKNPDAKSARLLDVACGTGRTLAQLHLAHPNVRLFGMDLSPFYLHEARQTLRDVDDVSLVADNAEQMPFRDASFDILTNVYLFHELPKNARRNVLKEMRRVLAPGGLLVIEDSAQWSESAEVGFSLERFPQEFHEPFYQDYLKDPLEEALKECGFEVQSVESHFVAKVVVARKPLD
jgi:ubiquinone/menaquinone biosynthesis C-methylase UbiE